MGAARAAIGVDHHVRLCRDNPAHAARIRDPRPTPRRRFDECPGEICGRDEPVRRDCQRTDDAVSEIRLVPARGGPIEELGVKAARRGDIGRLLQAAQLGRVECDIDGAGALIVERGTAAADALSAQGSGLEITRAASVEEARMALAQGAFDCVIVGRGIAKAAALRLLEELADDPRAKSACFILYPQRPLTGREQGRLRRIESTIVAYVAQTPEELTAHAASALHGDSGAAGAGEHAAQPSVAELRGRKVLLVDDDARNLFALASMLEDRGLEVVFGESGREALAALERHTDIDLVLMDIMMPGMDGNEAIAAIRRRPGRASLPIIAVTAKAMEGDREQCLSAGASDYITKPVEPTRLVSMIGSWLRR